MEQMSNIIKTNENCLSTLNLCENTENVPQNEQIIKLHDHIEDNIKEDVSVEFEDFEKHLKEIQEEETSTDTNSYYDLQDSENSRSDVGEPSKPQHIRIDFSPVDGLDDIESVQQKCLDFWKFVNDNPNLQQIANNGIEMDQSFTIESNKSIPTNRSDSCNNVNQTIKVFKGIANITRAAFETKQPFSYQDHTDNYLSYEVQKQKRSQVKLKKRYNEHDENQQSCSELKPYVGLSDGQPRTSFRGPDEVDKL